ncbi:hypothetical protein [Candidatus Poriferisodalis sp.]|uniref:hypothetical protein n=1 Tax=Candidatus Poriferisodalis sp. TaxID=3101277 RepID=UPI003D112E62
MEAAAERLTRAFVQSMYARLSARGVVLESAPARRPNSLLFVDLDIQQSVEIPRALQQLRRLSPVGLGHVTEFVFRWPVTLPANESGVDRALDEIARAFKLQRIHASAGFVHASVGSEPSIEWGRGALAQPSGASNDSEVLLACREVELASLLRNGRAMWTPKHYHYRLPSGRHSGTFVRLADAIRSPRDAEVLAWWLLEHGTDRLGILIDTSTVMSIVLALQRMLAAEGHALGSVITLSTYPATMSEFARAIRDAARDQSPVLALLSVSSSGALRDRLLTALGNMEHLIGHCIHSSTNSS